MFAIKMSNQPLNPISYSQVIGWFAWNCHSEIMKFWSWLGSSWAAQSFRSEGFQHYDPISLASRGAKNLLHKNQFSLKIYVLIMSWRSNFHSQWRKIFTLYATVKGELLKKVLIGISAFTLHRMVKQILKYNKKEKY